MKKAEKLIKFMILYYKQSPLRFSNDDMIHWLSNMEDEEFDKLLSTDEKELDGKNDYYGHPINFKVDNLFGGYFSLCHIFNKDETGHTKCIFCNVSSNVFDAGFKLNADSKKYRFINGIIRPPKPAESNALDNFKPKIHELVPELKDLDAKKLSKILEEDEDEV